MATTLSTVEIHLYQLNAFGFLTPHSWTEGNESFPENEPFLLRYSDTNISSLQNSTHWNSEQKKVIPLSPFLNDMKPQLSSCWKEHQDHHKYQ